MKKEPHIEEFTAKKGSGLHVRVSTTRRGRKISVDGGRLYYSDYKTKAEAVRAARRIRDEILADLGAGTAPAAETVADLFERSHELQPCALSTWENYERAFRRYMPDDLKQKRIADLTLPDVQLQLNRMSQTQTQHQLILMQIIWRRIFQAAFMLQLPVVDYSRMITLPRSRVAVRKQNRETTFEDFQRFIRACDDDRHWYAPQLRDLALVMYYTGIRLQEALGLYVDDVDLDRGLLHVVRSVGSTAEKMAQIVPLKTDGSARVVPIAPGLVPALERLISGAEADLLFADPDGSPLDVRYVSMHVRTIARENGLKFNLYALRHLFSADLFRQGVNPKVIQTLMGHASENMSLYYAYTTEDERTEAVLKRKPS